MVLVVPPEEPEASQVRESVPDLELYHPGSLEPDYGIDLAMRCEQAAFDADSRITNSDGAHFNSHESVRVYGNRHGFISGYPSTRHSLSCVMLGVGAAFDLYSGRKKHAPRWMQQIGCEWMYRLFTEPASVWKRYLKHNPRFVYHMIN